ncbi:MAG TPA: ABC transporter permease [Acidocella sp.]|jgi:peptide/nickel transport system permease protein|uniref:ABC transporter permease n=1 Tax=Acidocella sp. TaxID=50710 RepID=UPI002C52164B|nr:ABC transporter permease [Acidocella sp.]HVE23612.1 ABC transporter permease [Acidocella sp.]
MQSSLGARLLQIIPTMLLVSVIVFALQHLLPGDPAVMLAGDSAGDPHVVAQIRDQLLLNRPIGDQYLHWLVGVLHGNLGYSWELSAPVTTLLLQKLPVTLQLSAMAFVIALATGIPLGVISAVKKGTPLDWLATSVGLFGLSVPSFWLGIVLILLVSVDLGWLPPSGYVPLSQDPLQSLRTTIMPAFVLGNAVAAIIMRHTRSAMLAALHQDYVRTARAKGLSERVVVWRHALRNALIPVVTLAGLQLGTLLSGAVLTEQVFDIPGVGKLVVDAVFNRDYPVIQGVVLVTGLLYVLINLITDILYAVINPKLRGG